MSGGGWIGLDSGHRVPLPSSSTVCLQGWCLKKTKFKKVWNSRWVCVLRKAWLVWAEEEGNKYLGSLDLVRVAGVDVSGDTELVIRAAGENVTLKTETRKQRDEWADAIKKVSARRRRSLCDASIELVGGKKQPTLTFATTMWASPAAVESCEGFVKKRAVQDVEKKTTAFRLFRKTIGTSADWTVRYAVLFEDHIAYAKSSSDAAKQQFQGFFGLSVDTVVTHNVHFPTKTSPEQQQHSSDDDVVSPFDPYGPVELTVENPSVGSLTLEIVDALEALAWCRCVRKIVEKLSPAPECPPQVDRAALAVFTRGSVQGTVEVKFDATAAWMRQVVVIRVDDLAEKENYASAFFENDKPSRVIGLARASLHVNEEEEEEETGFTLTVMAGSGAFVLRYPNRAQRDAWASSFRQLIAAANRRAEFLDRRESPNQQTAIPSPPPDRAPPAPPPSPPKAPTSPPPPPPPPPRDPPKLLPSPPPPPPRAPSILPPPPPPSPPKVSPVLPPPPSTKLPPAPPPPSLPSPSKVPPAQPQPPPPPRPLTPPLPSREPIDMGTSSELEFYRAIREAASIPQGTIYPVARSANGVGDKPTPPPPPPPLPEPEIT